LAKIDELDIFPRSEGVPDPFLLLDGHGSRFEPPFLDYIADPEHPWEVCVGLPNGTHAWQVGDSIQQNGSYKPGLVIAKRVIVKEKQDAGEEGKIEKSDIVPAVNKATPGSYKNEEGNRHAIADRGWLPLNRGCQTMPEIIATIVLKKNAAGIDDEGSLSEQMPDSQDTTSSAYLASKVPEETLENLNFANGPAGLILNRINQQTARREGQVKSFEQVLETRKKRAENGERVSLINKRATSGLLVKAGIYSVNEAAPYLNEKAKNQEQAARAATFKKNTKDHRSKIGAYRKGLNVRDTLAEADWLSADYKTMIQFKRLRVQQEHAMTLELMNESNSGSKKKKKKDKQPPLKLQAIPSKLDDRKAMWEKYRKLSDPEMPSAPEGYVSDDENGNGRFSSADEKGSNDGNGGRFSSADEKGSNDGNGGRFSSADENGSNDGNGDRFSSADESSVHDGNGGRFSSADEKGSNDGNGGRFSSADEDGSDDGNGGRFSSADESSFHDGNGGRFSSAESGSSDDNDGGSNASSVDGNDGGRFSSNASTVDGNNGDHASRVDADNGEDSSDDSDLLSSISNMTIL
jgi:hypothetical protein